MANKLYFALASYFQFWAKIVLNKWNPIIIAVVGTAGKTSTLYLIQQVLKDQNIKLAHQSNAATAIALDILNLKQETFSLSEWLKFIVLSPFRAFTTTHDQSVYLCEMDTDRQGEMRSHTRLIKPHITCWTSCYAMHTQGFPGSSQKHILTNLATDMGFAVENNAGLILANADDPLLATQLNRTNNPIGLVSLDNHDQAVINMRDYRLSLSGTKVSFRLKTSQFIKLYQKLYPHKNFDKTDYPMIINLEFPYAVVSRANMYGVAMAVLVGLLLGFNSKQITTQLKNWHLPPGRMSIFAGIKTTTIIDSSYNSSPHALIDALLTLRELGGRKTIAVLGDMRELGALSAQEHQKIASAIIKAKIRRLILIGPEMSAHAYPILTKHGYLPDRTIFKTNDPSWAADLIKSEDFLRIGETILVKGSQNTLFLEGLVEQIMASPKDKKHLCRRQAMWEKKRSQIYNPPKNN